MKFKYTIWEIEPLKRGITAFNTNGEELGWIQLEKVGKHMHWKWYQEEDIGMTGGCLDDVRAMQKIAFNFRGKDGIQKLNEYMTKQSPDYLVSQKEGQNTSNISK